MDETLSIIHVVYSLGVGGQERVILDLAAAQLADGHRVATLVLSEAQGSDLEGEFAARNIPVERVAKGPGFQPKLLLRLTRHMRERRVRLVHTHNPMPLIYGAPAGRLAGAAVVHTKHGEHQDSPVRMTLRRQAARFVNSFVAVSEPTADFARQHRECAARKLRVIKNGTDLTRFGRDAQARSRVRAELGISDSAFVALCVGRFVPEKNQKDLVRAAVPLCSHAFHLVFAGDGPLLSEVKALAAEQGSPPSLHFLGQRSDVPALLAAADVYVIPSVTEGLPIGLIEAMASCLPVISTSVGGIPTALADGKLGLLVAPGRPEALRVALDEVRANPELARTRAARARMVALEEFGVTRMVRDYIGVYREVLGARGNG